MKDVYSFHCKIKNGFEFEFAWHKPLISFHIFSFRGKDFYKKKYKIAGNITKKIHFIYTFGN